MPRVQAPLDSPQGDAAEEVSALPVGEVEREAMSKRTDELAAFAMRTVRPLCWWGAHAVAREFGGIVCGYLIEDNPTALVGKSAGGHDFCVVDDRYIVDAWAVKHEGTLFNPVVDMKRSGPAWVRTFYGERSCWVTRKPLSKRTMQKHFNEAVMRWVDRVCASAKAKSC